MPWFITSICKDETIKRMREQTRDPRFVTSRSRTFGFYNTLDEAYKAVESNRCNLHECLYDYLVIEYIEPGIHPTVEKEYWWEWVAENNRWEDGIEKPVEFIGVVNWALG